jgi:hypothetical protein
LSVVLLVNFLQVFDFMKHFVSRGTVGRAWIAKKWPVSGGLWGIVTTGLARLAGFY